MSRSIPRSWLKALLDGRPAPGPLDAYDALNLADYGAPDLRFADGEALAPILKAIHAIAHLEMAEGAQETLGEVLGALAPGCLQTLQIRTTEAYSWSTDGGTFAHIAGSPAARGLRALALSYTRVRGLAALTGSALRDLERLELIGDLPARELEALTRPAPGLRALRSLTLTPDALTPEIAQGIAQNPDLVGLTEIELPLIQGGGFDWGEDYTGEAFLARFPPAFEALQALPGLQRVRVTSPYDAQPPELGEALQLAIVQAVTGRVRVEAPALEPELLELICDEDADLGYDPLGWEPSIHPLAVWVEALYRRGAAQALGAEGPAPSERDAEELDALHGALQARGFTDPMEHELMMLEERWGGAGLVGVLSKSGLTDLALHRSPAWSGSRSVLVLYDRTRISADEAASVADVEQLWLALSPDAGVRHPRLDAWVARSGAEAARALFEALVEAAVVIELTDTGWEARLR